MKLTLEQGAAASLLKSVAYAAQNNATTPQWASVLLKAENDRLTATCTDGDMWVTNSVPATIEEPGAACVGADRLSRLVASFLAGSQVSMSIEKIGLRVKNGRSAYSFAALPAEDFPSRDVRVTADGAEFEIAPADLAKLFSRTVDAVATDEVKYAQRGVNLRIDGKRMIAEATDGKLALRQWMAAPVKKAPKIIVPTKSVNAILKILTGSEPARVIMDPAFLFVDCGGQQINTKVIEGAFPDVDHAIPKAFTTIVDVPTGAFKTAISRVALFVSDKARTMELDFDNGAISIAVPEKFRATDDGTEIIDAKIEGDAHHRGAFEHPLSGVLKQISGDLTIKLTDSGLDTCVFLDSADPDWIGAICAVKL